GRGGLARGPRRAARHAVDRGTQSGRSTSLRASRLPADHDRDDARSAARRYGPRRVLMAMGHGVVVGAGPAGAALAYVLARRGIEVTLLERHTDFAREFRGEALMPSGVDAITQMGLGAALDALPQTRIDSL